MTIVRITDDGSVRGLGDGSVRAVDTSGQLEDAVTGSSTLRFVATATLTAMVAISGNSASAFSGTGTLDTLGEITSIAGTSSLGFGNSGKLSAAYALSGTAPLIFSDAGAISAGATIAGSSTLRFANAGGITGTQAAKGSSSVVFANAGVLGGFSPFKGAATLRFANTGTLASRASIAGQSPLRFASSGRVTGLQGIVFWDKFSAVYAARQTLINAILAKGKFLTDGVTLNVTNLTTQANGLRTDVDSTIAGLSAEITNRGAAITAEQTTRSAADSAMAKDISLIGASNAGKTAFILNQSTTQIGGGVTFAAMLSGLQSTDADTNARIDSETSARVSGDSANASAISSLSTTVNGNTASISTQQSSIDGIKASYVLNLDVNGYVAGWKFLNDGTTSDFTILADRFRIVTPGQTPKVPFAVANGNVYINTDLYMGNGRIVSQSGGYMKVQGTGFGTTNQFIEWFGPLMPIASCSESNAQYYLKTDGSAYFGGSLSAGTIKNASKSTDTSATASLVLGPFATNGATKSVTASYAFNLFGWATGNTAGAKNGQTFSADVRVYRTLDGGAEVQVQQFTASGTSTATYDGDVGQTTWQVSVGNSVTFNDLSAATTNMQLRIAIASRTTPFTTSTNGGMTQTLSLIETEG